VYPGHQAVAVSVAPVEPFEGGVEIAESGRHPSDRGARHIRPLSPLDHAREAGGGLVATAEAWDLELGATHVWDLRAVSLELGLVAGVAILRQDFETGGVAPPRTTAALQLSPLAGVSRDLGRRSYAFASLAAATYLYRLEDSTDGTTSFQPSFALRFAIGAGFRM